MSTCKNCGNNFEGRYCNNCRQPADTKRITWHDIGHQLLHVFTHADKGFLHTVKELTIRPGKTIREYLKGKRIDHINPFLYMIVLGGFASLLFASLHVKLLNKEIDLDSIERINSTLAHKHFAFLGCLILLLLTITDIIFYGNKNYILPELFVSNAFQVGQLLLFLAVMFPFLFLQNYMSSKFGMQVEIRPFIIIAEFLYLMFVRFQLYEAKGNNALMIKIALQLSFLYVIVQYVFVKMIVDSLK